MPDEATGGVKTSLDGAHLRVDARPARLVSLLKGGDGAPLVTAQQVSGEPHSEALPAAARQATFQVRDDVTVEATPAGNFVAIAEDDGRCLVIAYGGEVTVVPGGSDRFALAADEALAIPAGGGSPTVIPAADLNEDAHPELAQLLDAAADALLAPPAPAAAETKPTETKPTETKPTETKAAEKPAETKPAEKAAAAGAGAAAGAAKATPAKKQAATPAKAAAKSASPGGQRRKKGKKGRPQPTKNAGKKAVGAGAAAGAAGAGAAAAAAKPTAKAGGGGKPPTKQPPKGGGGGGGGDDGHDESYEDTPRDKRFLIGTVLVALVLAIGAVLLLSNVGGDDTEVATGSTTTTEPEVTTTEAPATTTTAKATTTTAAPTTTAKATTTTAKATTTTAAPTTTAPPVEAKYSIEPKSCVQNGNSITYTASVKNESTAPFDYTIDVSFKTADGTEVAKATANVSRLAPSRTADFSATGTSSRSLAGTGASCDVTRVAAKPSA